MSILDEQAKLHPKGTAIQVKSELFIDCPDHAHLLDKLEKEHSVIIIEQRPDSKGYAQADHDMFSWENTGGKDNFNPGQQRRNHH